MKKRILGLDTGTNSLGWAVIDRDENDEYSLVDKGTVIFQEGVKIEKGVESSKASERTEHRDSRKHYYRRRLRKIDTLRALIKYGLCPPLTDEELNLWRKKKIYPLNDDFMLWQRTNENEEKNPYYYRHVCLHEKLDLSKQSDRFILGRSLYHLAQRRGFLSNRLDTTSEDETGKVKQSISSLNEEMANAGFEFLGDYFHYLYSTKKSTVRLRSRYTDREGHYLKEFNEICRVQHLDDDMVNDLRSALYFQRPLKSQRHGVGLCTFEPKKPRCAASHPDFEEYRMLSFVNAIKIQAPKDAAPRGLNDEEMAKIEPLFYRKSSPNFDFDDIAKKIAGKNNYMYDKDQGDKPYKFNYRMTQGVAGCTTIAQLKAIFGEEWKQGIAETYIKMENDKSVDEAVNDIWNVLYSFSSEEKLKEFAKTKLQLDDERADKFSKIRLTSGFASLSLKAIRKILPFLRQGMIYSDAVFFANIPTIISKELWERDKDVIMDEFRRIIYNTNAADREMQGTMDFMIKNYLKDNYDLKPGAADKLYHPSMIETYPDAKIENGVYQLGSPRTNAVRNPMAMRSLHQVRKLVNALLRKGIIDNATEVHVEYSRDLNNANVRKAIANYNKEQEKLHKTYRDEIKKLYKEETGIDIEPTKEEILKFQLWEEQGRICLYTGRQIGISDFIGPNPKFDIEHTIPRSVGGDSTMENLTLCEKKFNRDDKRAKLPTQLANYDEIMARLDGLKEKIVGLEKQINAKNLKTFTGMEKSLKDSRLQKKHLLKMKKEYLLGKYRRFTMTEVPEGFARRQGAGIGLISKYAGLYLKSLFHKPDDRNKSNVYIVKGPTTAEFRKLWGLQDEYTKKKRVNHVHHCIDAITIACIGKKEYDEMARYFREYEAFERSEANRPTFKQPWPTFAADLNNLEKELLIVHSTKNNLPKKAKKVVKTSKGKFIATGDSARGSLHLDTYYGAIERDGEIKYVVRKALTDTTFFDSPKKLDLIVDEAVRDKVKQAVEGKNFKEAMAEPIYMNKEKGILIKKVRCYMNSVRNPLNIRKHRDLSTKEYKQQFHVANDSNYIMAIYEGLVKGKVKREFEIVNMLDAANYFKTSTSKEEFPTLVPQRSANGLEMKSRLFIGTMVLLYEKSPDEINFYDMHDISKRLYKVTGLSSTNVSGYLYGVISLRHHEEARPSNDVRFKNGAYKNDEQLRPGITMLHTQINALVEGEDFTIDELGKIKLINR